MSIFGRRWYIDCCREPDLGEMRQKKMRNPDAKMRQSIAKLFGFQYMLMVVFWRSDKGNVCDDYIEAKLQSKGPICGLKGRE